MRTDPIANLYHGLKNKERAALAFCYLTDTNELELKRVVAAVPLKGYMGPDAEYQAWFDGFFSLACLWAIEHWKAQSCNFAALAGVHLVLGMGEIPKAKAMIEAYERWESRLLALDQALATVCAEHGLDPDAVRRLAGAEPFACTLNDVVVDQQYQVAMQSNLSRLLTANR